MAAHALVEFEAERAAHPDLAVTEVLAGMSLGPSEHVVLLPRYIELQQAEIATAGAVLAQRVATLQDPTTRDGAALGVGAGPDGAGGRVRARRAARRRGRDRNAQHERAIRVRR